jgi:hypothetical protein
MKPGPLPKFAVDHFERGQYLAPAEWQPGTVFHRKQDAIRTVLGDERPTICRDIRSGRLVAANAAAKKVLKPK